MPAMAEFDLVVRGGTVATASGTARADVGIAAGVVRSLGEGLPPGRAEIDARGKLVLPGGVDAHTHIEQRSSMGVMTADDFESATLAAACGGTTTVLSFAAQQRGESPREVVAAYHRAAGPKAVIDYGFHLIMSDPTPEALEKEVPALVDEGVSSFKVYMTYEAVRVNDRQLLEVLAAARRMGALTMVHAENHGMIGWMSGRLVEAGHVAPKFHAVGHAKLAESEATGRAIGLAELVDAPLYVVHVSSKEAAEAIEAARSRGLKVFAETCPQYLLLTADDLDQPGMEGAMTCCSPPPRDRESQEAIWAGLRDGVFDVLSSDHAPYTMDAQGKLAAGPEPPFPKICNGVPGIELRMPLVFSEGVGRGRIGLERFVEVCCETPARLFGMWPRKGTLAPGSDADLAVWDPDREITVRWEDLHDRTGYTPYAGMRLKGWPETVVRRGEVVARDRSPLASPGSGAFVRRGRPESAAPLGRPSWSVRLARRFGAQNFLE